MSQVQQRLSAEEVMLSRHSVRKFERGIRIPDSELNEILKLAGTAPSSWNLQHWRFLVIQDQNNKDKLLPLAFNQQQVSDASAVIIVLGDLEANRMTPIVYAEAAPEIRDMMVKQVDGAYANNPAVARDEAIRNGSLAAMQLMLVAKAKGYDTVPMGGYDSGGVIKALRIPDRYIPIMMVAMGKASSPARATERLPVAETAIYESF